MSFFPFQCRPSRRRCRLLQCSMHTVHAAGKAASKRRAIQKRHCTMSSSEPSASPQSLSQLLSSLTQAEIRALQNFQKVVSNESAYVGSSVMREHPIRFCLRYLRADDFNVEEAGKRYEEYVQLTKEFDFGNTEECLQQEYTENGPMFSCGHDVNGSIVIVCRPCSHFPQSATDSDTAVNRCVYTMQLCADRLPPGHERATMIYDAGGISTANWDMVFVKKIGQVFGTCFPERIGKILVCNNGFLVSSLWTIVKSFLDPVTASKIVFCGTNFESNLSHLLLPKHRYLEYLIKRRDAKKSTKETIDLPKSDSYFPCWKQSLLSDYENLQDWDKFKEFNLINDSRCIENIEVDALVHKDTIIHADEGNCSKEHRMMSAESNIVNITPCRENSPSEDGIITEDVDLETSTIDRVREKTISLGSEKNGKSSFLALGEQLYRVLDIKDRTYHLKTYKSCFLGSDCVALLIALGHARTIEQAEALGDSLITMGVIQHVTNDHNLKNDYLFYRFLDFQPSDAGKEAKKSNLILHPMLPKFLDFVGIMKTFHSSSKESAGPMVGQLKKMGKGGILWNQRYITVQGEKFMWKHDVSSETYNGVISLTHYICKPCKHLTSTTFSVFKLVDVHNRCLYFGSSNHAEVFNWIKQIQLIQAEHVSKILGNLNNAFSEMVQSFHSQYELNAETRSFMKDPAVVASLVSSFRALSKSRPSRLLNDDFDAEDVEIEVLL